MLIGLPAILGPDLLYTLRAMGHGDEIALVDGNYPAQDHARRLVRADGHGIEALLEAILQLLPVEAAARASLMNDPAQSNAYHLRVDALIVQRTGLVPQALDGAALYPRIRAAHSIVATSELALYGNVILRKGVIGMSSAP